MYRNTSLNTAVEGGTINIVYNPAGPTGNKWQIDRKYLGDASIDFNVTDTGQIQFSTSALSGTSHTGLITFSAQALLQSY